jgi:hypothetical protein
MLRKKMVVMQKQQSELQHARKKASKSREQKLHQELETGDFFDEVDQRRSDFEGVVLSLFPHSQPSSICSLVVP